MQQQQPQQQPQQQQQKQKPTSPTSTTWSTLVIMLARRHACQQAWPSSLYQKGEVAEQVTCTETSVQQHIESSAQLPERSTICCCCPTSVVVMVKVWLSGSSL
jgi:hypothetical protein